MSQVCGGSDRRVTLSNYCFGTTFSTPLGRGVRILPYDANSTVSQSRASVFAMHVSRERGGPSYL